MDPFEFLFSWYFFGICAAFLVLVIPTAILVMVLMIGRSSAPLRRFEGASRDSWPPEKDDRWSGRNREDDRVQKPDDGIR